VVVEERKAEESVLSISRSIIETKDGSESVTILDGNGSIETGMSGSVATASETTSAISNITVAVDGDSVGTSFIALAIIGKEESMKIKKTALIIMLLRCTINLVTELII